MSTFPVVGDTHLYAGPRQADRLAALDGIIAAGLERADLAAWLWPGDVFDTRSTIDMRNALRDRVRTMAQRAPVIGCYGNHDVPGDLDIFGDLRTEWPVRFAAVPAAHVWSLPTGEQAAVFTLPYPTAAGLVARGVAGPELAAAARAALEAIFLDAGHALAQARATGAITLAIGHADYVGAQRGIGQPNVAADTIALDDALVARLGCPLVLNHIHRPQQAGTAAYYAGSICRMDWGETERKSRLEVRVTELNTAPRRHFYDIVESELAVPPMYHVECWLGRDGVVSWQATAGPDGPAVDMPATWDGCEVRLRARYRQSEGIVLAKAEAEARAMFRAAYRLQFEPVCVPDRAVRAPEVAAARTLADKVAAWARVAGAVLPETAAAKLAALETTDPDLLVANVERALAEVKAQAVQV